MDPGQQWVVTLSEASNCPEELIGGKAAKLGRARSAGFVVPDGFCVTTIAYEEFLSQSGLAKKVAMELGRKPLESMRWEEVWDTALRIRSEFLRAPMPVDIASAICQAAAVLGGGPLAVRSSAIGEDSAGVSFAGLHESVVGVAGDDALFEAVRRVWASLWSDAALLYRNELSLDPERSRMAVLVQRVIIKDRSGVAFGRDPRNLELDCAIVEAVPGQCSLLVDGAVDPDRWVIRRSSGELVEWRSGVRDEASSSSAPLLQVEDLNLVLELLKRVERLFGWPPDLEWTGRSAELTLLQARPITTDVSDKNEKRSWYLSLRPGAKRLKDLARRVSEQLIPQLEQEGRHFASEDLTRFNDPELADAIATRFDSLRKWEKIYWDEFIPFAHGVRQLARYYNDAVRPSDPYEFVGLLRKQDMLASRRNREFARLADRLRVNSVLKEHLEFLLNQKGETHNSDWLSTLKPLSETTGGTLFLQDLQRLLQDFMDVTVSSERLVGKPELILPTLLEMTESGEQGRVRVVDGGWTDPETLQSRLFEAVGPDRLGEAIEVLRIGRLSWQLRDDDNLLVSRVESQLYRAADIGLKRLRTAGRIRSDGLPSQKAIPIIVEALRDRSQSKLEVPSEVASKFSHRGDDSIKARQLTGQPASPGLAAGAVRKIKAPESFARFRSGDILVCDAIQPMMTHLVPLAAAVVERRGGMLIHGAIIARELGIPCVNGILDAMEVLDDGDFATVDGHLGIVTVGKPEFEIELDSIASEKN